MKRMILGVLAVGTFALSAEPAFADGLSSSNVMNDVLDRFHDAAATWGPAIQSAASRLFWSLVVISMVWTFGLMAMRKADIGEFFSEFVRFTIFTGFFWWLLTHANTGMNLAGTIVASLQTLGAEAGGLSNNNLGPSSILDLGFELYDKTVQATTKLGWRKLATALTMELLAIAVLIVLALIAINLLLVTASAWILLYAGVFFLGFGGSRWTSDMAINYYKTVLGVAAQLMAMILLVAIGRQFINHYYDQISEGMASQELAVMLVISLILLFLVNRVPAMISGIVTGASVGAIGSVGSFGAGAAVGATITAASLATGGVAAAGKAMMGAAGVGSAVQAAMQKAAGSMSNGGDMPGLGSVSGNAGSKSDAAGTAGSSPFAQAAGFGGSGGGSGGGFSRAAKLAAGTVGELAKGAGAAVKQSAQQRVSETAGGKLAASIRASMEPPKADNTDAAAFDGDSLGGAGATGGGDGWINQTGGFGNLSEADQAKAAESHAEWQAKSEGNTFDVEDYVSYVQERQQERNSEIDAFVNRDNRS
ncbi:P-type conjugative transfer protein TrbL [Kerstersia gyiorum]|uniref:P-type conjugative transfer protein TrbL n=1 Tax=Kerstersia gyiorum TaxID=206506 RepID=UPI00209EEE5F|nr:P-type conjugative transfer protein TrbL [Kerstersia gyiorum]MCP1633706.1 type IV secretion system protein VirB6/type IV secretion system protein TrbL [Kerstersia gyiorum]MCP1636956.1 type IV secretion system protein VirB6/type IV secretion system protein TrbL [Kerstersia gyiorum]MCP1670433.1 type IV secretion system protein VirB6/type IV secretion system protein TrbL [Kerstersia gyiorum]MCP1678914.1 type IV secretion system protein VirB6/type IV secretion system protein TrbL [Kerstersia gyi